MTDERAVLQAYLDHQRGAVLETLDGLGDTDLRRPVLPSGWSCVGMVRHLTLDDEMFWFRAVVGGDPDAIAALVSGDAAWQVGDDEPVDGVLAAYREETARSNDVLARTSLDAPPAWWPGELFGSWRLDTVREVVLHVIVETANHVGHLDAARELVDGRQRIVLTD